MAKTQNLTVMFTDIVGFTERTSRQSRAQNSAMLRDHNRLLLPLVARFDGRRVKSMGDALMLAFDSPTDAVRCGMAMHDALAGYNYGRSETEQIHIRIAVNVGEVRVDAADLFGEAVNVASRVEGLTPPDQIYFTEAVYLAMNKAEVPSTSIGRHKLKGIPEPIKLFTVPPRQINRLIPGGEDLGNEPGEFPFGGMHKTAPPLTPLADLATRVRNLDLGLLLPALPTLRVPVFLRFEPGMPPPRRLAALGTILFAVAAWAWWLQRPLAEEVDSSAAVPAAEPTPVAADAPVNPPEEKSEEQQRREQARAWVEKAHAAFERNRRREAVPAYARALALEPELQNDPLVARRIVACLSWASDLAIPLVRKYPSPAIVEALSQRTAQANDRGGQRAADLLGELGRTDRIAPVFLALAELGKADSCQAKLLAVQKLRALHDPQSLPALKSSLGGGISGWFRSRCYRSEAEAAIEEIEGKAVANVR